MEEISTNQTYNKGIANEDEIKKLESFIDGMIIKASFGSKTDPYFNLVYERIILQLKIGNKITKMTGWFS